MWYIIQVGKQMTKLYGIICIGCKSKRQRDGYTVIVLSSSHHNFFFIFFILVTSTFLSSLCSYIKDNKNQKNLEKKF